MSDALAFIILVTALGWTWWYGYQTGRTTIEIAHLKADTAVKKAEIVVLQEEAKVWDEALAILKQRRGEL